MDIKFVGYITRVTKIIGTHSQDLIDWEYVLKIFGFEKLIEKYPDLMGSSFLGEDFYTQLVRRILTDAIILNQENTTSMIDHILKEELSVDKDEYTWIIEPLLKIREVSQSSQTISKETNEITREKLYKVVNYYMENDDYVTARNHIKSWGKHIEGFNIENELKKFDEGKYIPGFWRLIHKDIRKVSKKKFEDGHYPDSVESAFKEINHYVKNIYRKKTGKEDDGDSLMNNAFTFNYDRNSMTIKKEPTILLDNLQYQSGRDVQLGYMFIFKGSILAIRNPKAHSNINITKEEAIHSIFLASKLMYKLDNAKN